MTKTQKQETLKELQVIHDRAEALADVLDPSRTFTAKDEVTRITVKACDLIVSQSSHAISVIQVSEDSK